MTAFELMHGLVLDDGQQWGTVATGWQRDDARAVLDGDGAPTMHWLGRPKGASKSTDVAAMVVCWLVEQAPPNTRAYVFSADLDQSNRLLDRARGIIDRTEGLASVLKVEARRIVHVGSRAAVEAMPADVAGSEGLLSPLIVLEELPNWPETRAAKGMLTAALSSHPKWPGCRLVVIGHAGDPGHFSHRVLEFAMGSPVWRVNVVAGPLPWVPAEVLEVQAGLLLPSEYARRHLNIWCAAEDQLTTLDDVRGCVRDSGVLEPRKGVSYVMTLDVGLTNDQTVVTVGHLERDAGKSAVVVDRQAAWKGSKAAPVDLSEVEAYIVEAARLYNHARLVFDPFQAAHLTQRLRRAGVRAEEFTFTQTSIGRLAVTLFHLLRDRLLDIPDDPELIDELVHVRLLERSPGVYRIDHDSGRHDDRVIGVALLAERLLEHEGARRGGMRVRDVGMADDPFRFLMTKAARDKLAAELEAKRPKGRGIRVRF